jgi:predicted urease superfamily metal-dependent hydrolase
MLNLDHTGGKNMQDWVERGIEVITKFAKENGCEGIEGIGRHGQWHWVKNKKGWKKPASLYEYIFEEKHNGVEEAEQSDQQKQQ